MARDPLEILGLPRGAHSTRELEARFFARRELLLSELDNPARYEDSRRELEELHVAYACLRRAARDGRITEREVPRAPEEQLREVIRASLEDGLLRYSRRQLVLARAQQLGIGEFRTHLLIAEEQFGGLLPGGTSAGDSIPATRWLCGTTPRCADRRPRAARWRQVAQVVAIASGLCALLVHWAG